MDRQQPAPLTQWLVWGGLLLVILVIGGVFFAKQFQPGDGKQLPVLTKVTDFTLTNQFGRAVSLADLQGKVWIADIIFTRCPGPCTKMTRIMSELHAAHPEVHFVSITADPAFDSSAILKSYADRFKADHERWHFLTGPKQELYDLATKGLWLAAQDTGTESLEERFIHSTLFVVVDKRGQLRAAYESEDPQLREKIAADVQKLLRQ